MTSIEDAAVTLGAIAGNANRARSRSSISAAGLGSLLLRTGVYASLLCSVTHLHLELTIPGQIFPATLWLWPGMEVIHGAGRGCAGCNSPQIASDKDGTILCNDVSSHRSSSQPITEESFSRAPVGSSISCYPFSQLALMWSSSGKLNYSCLQVLQVIHRPLPVLLVQTFSKTCSKMIQFMGDFSLLFCRATCREVQLSSTETYCSPRHD